MIRDQERKAVVVTGVSSGIGQDAARYLAEKNYLVFGTARKAGDAADLEKAHPENFQTLLFDVTDNAAILKARDAVRDRLDGRRLRALINNAGGAAPGPMQLMDDAEFRRQIEVGLFGVRSVTNAFLPLLGAEQGNSRGTRDKAGQNSGKIINISSISGILNTPINGAYCVAKHAMESLGEVYRRELYPYGIDVISIQPGPVQSRIWEKNLKTMEAYAATDYGAMVETAVTMMANAQKQAVPAETVSRLIHQIIEAKRPKTSYIIHRSKWRVILMSYFLPSRIVDRMIWKAFNP